jgi:hypothetical protein
MGKLLRIRALSETLTPTSPAWSAMPSPTIFSGSPGTYALPVTNATSATWVSPGSKPAWLTITAGSPPTLSWGTDAPVGDTAAVVLRAVSAGGTTADCAPFTLSVQARVSTPSGLWGTSYNYNTPATWGMYARDNTTRLGNPAHTIAYLNTGYVKSKDMLGVYNPAQDRIVYMGGDPDSWSINGVDGFDNGSGSNGTFWGSFALSDPRRIKREAGTPDDPSKIYSQRDDGPFLVHDEANGRAVYHGSSTFGWDLQSPRNAVYPAAVSPVTRLGPTSARFAGAISDYPVGIKLRFEITHPVGGAVSMRGRVTAVSDAGGGNIDVTVSWHDPNCSFQNPQSVMRAVDPWLYSAGYHWSKSGAWQEASDFVSYDEVKNKKQCRLLAFNYGTGEVTRLLFDLQGAATGSMRYGGVYLSATATGRGPEIWATDPDGITWTRYDLAALTATNYATTAGADTRSCLKINQGCADDDGNIYMWLPLENKLRIVNIRGATPSVTVKTHDYGSIIRDPGTGLATDFNEICYGMVWNRDIRRIEFYITPTGKTIGGNANPRLFLLDPSKAVVGVEYIGDTDDTGSQIRAATFVRVPKTPQETWMFGGNNDNALSADQKLRVFIGGNKRKWANVTHGDRWINNFGRGSNPNTYGSSTPSQTDKIPLFAFGAWVEGVDNSGNPTGVLYHRIGGDGDYAGSEVVQIRLDQIGSGSTVPLQANLSTDLTTASEWKNRSWATRYPAGGTGSQSDICLNPANLSQWIPVPIHTWGVNSYVPGWGYVEDFAAPLNLPSGYDNLYGSIPWIEHLPTGANPLTTQALRFWSESGANAGLWVKGPLKGSIGRSFLADYNGASGKLIGFNKASNNYSQVWEWTPGGSLVVSGNAYVRHNGENKGVVPVSTDCAIFWLTGSKYLIVAKGTGDNYWPGPWIVGYDHATPAGEHTLYKGANGSAILDGMSQVTVTIDRARQEIIWWCLPSSAIRYGNAFYLYRSPISDPMNLKRMYFVGEGGSESAFLDEIGGSGLRIGGCYDGYLYTMKKSGVMPVDDGDYAGQIIRLPIY